MKARALAVGAWCVVAACAPVGALQRSTYFEIERARAALTERTVVVDDVTFSVAEGGAGPPVLLLHGFSASKETWYAFARHFVDDHRVIVPDLAPFGAGSSEGLSNSVEAQVARLDALLSAMGVHRAHVVGNSMGGYIGALLAVRHPTRVATLTLIDAAGVDMPRASEGAARLAASENLFLIDDAEDAETFFDLLFVERPPMTPSIRADFIESNRARREDLRRWFDELRGEWVPLEPVLGEIGAPTLVVWGREDRLLDVSMADVFARHVPDVRVHVMPGVGHCPQMERPDETAALLHAFIAARTAPTPSAP